MNYYGRTDTGKIRTNNQDCFGIYTLSSNAMLFVVCDGMGGAAGGEVASALAIEAFSGEVRRQLPPNTSDGRIAVTDKDAMLCLSDAVTFANTKVYDSSVTNPALSGMGTTLVAALVFGDDFSIYSANVGDSRLYQLTYDKIEQLSCDHSLVQRMVDMGRITREEARTYPGKNIILRSVGTEELVKCDVEALDTSDYPANKYLMLCSDGLTNMLTDTEILTVVTSPLSVKEKTECLITLANEKGGYDNITVILIEF